MNKSQMGFSASTVILLLVIVGLIGGTGWYVLQQQKDTPTSITASSAVNNTAPSTTKQPVNTTITDVSITLKTEADLDKLPSITPASFKTFMREKLEKNTPDVDGCVIAYDITRISAVNIKGGGSATKLTGDNTANSYCVGGAPGIWVLTPAATWEEETLNGARCKSENGGLIYEEFAPTCIVGEATNNKMVKNPNGSINTLSKQL